MSTIDGLQNTRRRFMQAAFIGTGSAMGAWALHALGQEKAAADRLVYGANEPLLIGPSIVNSIPLQRDKMRVTKLETFLVKPRWLFLKIHTDAGIVGWGERRKRTVAFSGLAVLQTSGGR